MKRFIVSLSLLALAACSGGGGGGTGGSGGGGVAPVPTPGPPAPSVQGDMLSLVPSRGWNYHSIGVSPAITITLYADPAPVNGVRALIGSGVTGTVATVATSPSTMDANLLGALGIVTDGAYDASVYSEVSLGSTAAVPGTPLLVPGTLTLGQSWTPYPGATASVIAVGTVPNAIACPVPASGARVRYTFPGYDGTLSYVPGCGITDYLNNANGAELTLVSVGLYPGIGELAEKRRVESVTLLDTARSVLGLERNAFAPLPGLSKFF